MDLYLPLVYSTALMRHLFFHLRGGGGGGECNVISLKCSFYKNLIEIVKK